MLLSNVAHQVIEDIINQTEGVTTELRQHLYQELKEQLEAKISQAVEARLDEQQTQAFNQLLDDQTPPDPTQVRTFLDQTIPDIDTILNQTITEFKKQYLEN